MKTAVYKSNTKDTISPFRSLCSESAEKRSKNPEKTQEIGPFARPDFQYGAASRKFSI